MQKKIKPKKLSVYFAVSLVVYFLFFLWEGGRLSVVTLSNAAFLFALVLTIILMALWLWQERAFSGFFESCRRFFLKNYQPRDRSTRNVKKKRYCLGYGVILSGVYYFFSILLLLFS